MTTSEIHKICLGTVQFGLEYGINNSVGLPTGADIFDILDFAYNNGIMKLDSADAYGNALDIIGHYHRDSSNKFLINSKFSISPKSLESKLDETLIRLNLDKLNLYQFHDYNEFEKNPDIQFQLKALKKAHKVNQVGVSVYSSEEMIEASKHDFVDVIQFPFNLLDNRSQRSVAINLCVNRGKSLHARSVFLQGLFYKKFKDYPYNLKPLLPYMKVLRGISLQANIPMAQLSLNYALQDPDIDTVIIGVEKLSQLQENVNNAHKTLPKSVVDQINSICVRESELLYPKNW